MADFEINKRLEKLIREVYRTTPFAFSQKYNDNGGVKTSQIIRRRNGVSSKMLETILKAYPEISKTWLLTGEGEMLKQSEVKEQAEHISSGTIEMSREVFDLITSLQKIIQIQQETIRNLTSKNGLAAPGDAEVADVG